MLSWSHINDTEDGGPRETDEAREARHNAAYKEALFLHGEGSPHSDAWARARHLYESVLADEYVFIVFSAASMGESSRPSTGKKANASSFKATPVRFLCLKNLADMSEKEGNDLRALELQVAAAEEDETDLAVWLKMARIARRAGLLNLARLALERLLGIRGDHILALRTLKDVLLEIGDVAATREVTKRLTNLDAHGDHVITSFTAQARATKRSHTRMAAWDCDQTGTISSQTPQSSGIEFIERSLQFPSWERVGSILMDLEHSICRGGGDIGGDGTSSSPSPSPTLSAPVRIKFPRDIDLEAIDRPDDDLMEVDAGQPIRSIMDAAAAEENGGGKGSPAHEHATQPGSSTQRRRPSVDKAMQEYSDGASSDSDHDGEDKSGGGAQSGADESEGSCGRKGKGKGARNATRRTSARRQRQDEMREANVAAARENDMKFRVASLFFPGDEEPCRNTSDNGQNSALCPSEEVGGEGCSWWPDLEKVENDGGRGEAASGSARITEEEEAALVAKVLPMWKKRHDEDCRRCGGEGMLVCCDFCHRVFHPRCLEVTPTLESLFACSSCKEEAASIAWELRDRDATSNFLEGGMPDLRKFLRAAEVIDGRVGNAGVVDLMRRWLQGVANAPPEELCTESRIPDQLDATCAVSHLASLALSMEPIVRGYLPTRAFWLPATIDPTSTCTEPLLRLSTCIAPELGLSCELLLAEMHLDRALASTARQRGGRREAALSCSTPAASTASSMSTGAAANTGGASKVTDGSSDKSGKCDKAPAAKAGIGSSEKGCLLGMTHHLSAEMAAEHLSAADRAILLLEPFFFAFRSLENAEAGEGARANSRSGRQVDEEAGAASDSQDMPWTFRVRWWWLRGLRAKHADERDWALECFRRCERMLRARTCARGDGNVGLDDEEDDGAVVVMPYCAVHPRIDSQVVRGILADMELSCTSEAAREAFEKAIRELSTASTSSDHALPVSGDLQQNRHGGTPSEKSMASTSRADVSKKDTTGSGLKVGAGRELGKGSNLAQGKPMDGLNTDGTVTSSAGLTLTVGETMGAVAATSTPSTIPPPSGPNDGESGAKASEGDKKADSPSEDPGSTAGDPKLPRPSSDMSTHAMACASLASLLRGLESRFLERVHVDPLGVSPTTEPTPGIAGTTEDGKLDVATSALAAGGWSFRFTSHSAEELLADFLEREKPFFLQASKDIARAHESWGEGTAGKPLAPQMGAGPSLLPLPSKSSTNSRVHENSASAAGMSSSVAEGAAGAVGVSTSEGSRDGGVLSAAYDGGQGQNRRPPGHIPLAVSGPELGNNASVFTMMVRSALILRRYETAVLIAVRCLGHFLDVVDLLDSPRGPLSPRGRRGTGHTGVLRKTQGGGGLGVVSLLLTTQEVGAERRIDRETTSACCDFLVHALAAVIWAISHQDRKSLLGDGVGGGAIVDLASARANGRRSTVLRCLARLTRHSMHTENIRVLKLSVIVWQALIAVAPLPTPAPIFTIGSSKADSTEASQTVLRNVLEHAELAEGAGAKVAKVPELIEIRDELAADVSGCQTQDVVIEEGMVVGHGSDSSRKTNADQHCNNSETELGGDSKGGQGRRAAEFEAFNDPERALVRCLCGIIASRWSQTSSLARGKTPKKVWVLHLMETVHALAQTLETQRARGSRTNSSLSPSDDDVRQISGESKGAMCAPDEVSPRFFSVAELREIVNALMGLSRLSNRVPSTLATSSTFPRGLKLACALAITAIGVQRDTSPLDVPRKVKLLEALHDHLKGLAADTSEVKPGRASQPGKSGDCADGDGVFLKTALLYLASDEVSRAVEEDRQKRGSSGSRSAWNVTDSASSCSASSTAEETEGDEERSEDEDNEMSGDGDDGNSQGGAGMDVDGGAGRHNQKRSKLEERVVRVRAQCQACLYDVAVVPCEDHRCSSTPKPPSTVAEAHALYACWETRLPTMRRPRALRLLEAVITNEAFAFPPPTRFTNVVETYLFSTCGEGTEARSGRNNLGDGGVQDLALLFSSLEVEDGTKRCGGRNSLPDGGGNGHADNASGDLADGQDEPRVSTEMDEGGKLTSSACRDEPYASGVAMADVGTRDGVSSCKNVAHGGVKPQQLPKAMIHTETASGVDTGTFGGSEAWASDEGMDSRAVGQGSGSCSAKSVNDKVRGRDLGLPREKEAFSSVYIGLYRYLGEAKGIPYGFKSRLTRQPADEVMSDMEASLMQGIRLRFLDLGFSLNRQSSWKGLAQCAARLVAIYLDAFPPTCHQLGLPLTSFGVTAATESNADITSHLNSGGGEDTQLPGVASTVKADDSAATGAAEANVTESAPTPAAVASPQLNAPTTDVDAQDESSDESYINVEDDSSNGGDSYKEAMGIQSVLNVDATLSAMECIEVEELEVGSILVEAPNRTANAVTSVSSSVPVISENTCPQPPRAESFPEGSHLKDTTLPTEQTRTIYSDRTGDEPDMSDSSLQSKADGCGMLREVVKDVEPSRLVPSLSPSAEDVPQGHLDGQLPATPETTPEITSGTSDKPARQCAEGLSKRAASVLGLRAVPGPELLPFFSGTALDSASARGSGSSSSGGRGCGATSGVHGSRVSAISTGLRILVEAGKGRTSEEGAALGGLAERIADGTASQEEWNACLGHASIAAAVYVAERSFAAWRMLAEAALTRSKRESSTHGGTIMNERRGKVERRVSEALKELQECYEEEAFMTYMVARDVWAGDDDAHASAGFDDPTPAGLEVSGRRRSLERSLSLLRQAKCIRATASSIPSASSKLRLGTPSEPPSSAACSSGNVSNHPAEALSDDLRGTEMNLLDDRGQAIAKRQELCSNVDRGVKRMKLSVGYLCSGESGRYSHGVGGDVTGGFLVSTQGQGREEGESDMELGTGREKDDDLLPWQVRFVMGRLCARLGRHPKMVLDNLSQALRLAKAEHVPLEDELECLCRLHTARAELILTGDTESFLGVAHLVEAYAFCEDEQNTSGVRDNHSSQPQPSAQQSPPQAIPSKAHHRANESLSISSPFQGSVGDTGVAGSTVSTKEVGGGIMLTSSQEAMGTAHKWANGGDGSPKFSPRLEADILTPQRSACREADAENTVGCQGEGGTRGQVGAESRRLAALENCLVAFESCLKKRKWQHTAIFAIANVLLRGEAIAKAARRSNGVDKASGKTKERSFGHEAARSVISRLFEKRQQQLWLAISMTDGMVGPGLALLGSRRRKLHALRRKYMGLYVDLLEVTKGSAPLHDLLRRTKTARETREEIVWVQARILRALLGILQSEIEELSKCRQSERQAVTATTAAAAGTTSTESLTSSPPTSEPSGLGPAIPEAGSIFVGEGKGVTSVGQGTVTSTTAAVTEEPPQQLSHPAHVERNTQGNTISDSTLSMPGTTTEVADKSAEHRQPSPMLVPTSAPAVTNALVTAGVEQGRLENQTKTATEASNSQPDAAIKNTTSANSTATTAPATSAAPATSGASSKLESEKLMLERAWDLYLKVLDLDGSAPNHLLSGRSGVSTVTTSSSDGIISGQRVQATTSTLLGNAEEVLVSAWQAFGAANPALLDLVEMQNPPRVLEGMGGGSVRGSLVEGVSTEGRERGCGGIGSLQRARACCNAVWPDKLGKGKFAKSKFRLKRPPPNQSQAASSRGAPRPRARSPVPSDRASGSAAASSTAMPISTSPPLAIAGTEVNKAVPTASKVPSPGGGVLAAPGDSTSRPAQAKEAGVRGEADVRRGGSPPPPSTGIDTATAAIRPTTTAMATSDTSNQGKGRSDCVSQFSGGATPLPTSASNELMSAETPRLTASVTLATPAETASSPQAQSNEPGYTGSSGPQAGPSESSASRDGGVRAESAELAASADESKLRAPAPSHAGYHTLATSSQDADGNPSQVVTSDVALPPPSTSEPTAGGGGD